MTLTQSRPRLWPGNLIAQVVLFGGSLLMLTPFFWLISSSLKAPHQIYLFPPQ